MTRNPILHRRRTQARGVIALVFLVAVALLPLVTSCRSQFPANISAVPATPAPAAPVPPPAEVRQLAAVPDADELQQAIKKAAAVDTGIVLPERNPPVSPAPAPASEYHSGLDKIIKDPDARIPAKYNFDGSDLALDVIPIFAKDLEFDYLVDPAVKGTVNLLIPPTEMTVGEVRDLFEHILWLSAAYASPIITHPPASRPLLHILPFTKMREDRRIFAKRDPVANIEVAMLQVYNTKSADMRELLKPFATDPSASITDLARLNSLLIVESPANMEKLRELLTRLDDRGEARWPMKCIRCRSVDADVLREELQTLLPVLGLPVTDKAMSGGEIKLTALPRLQVLVISAALPEVVAEVEQWAQKLDQDIAAEQETIYSYNVRHSTADRLAEALGVFFSTSGASSTKAAGGKATSNRASGPTTGTTLNTSMFGNR